ncbi:MAG TPA: hypothetical protein VFA27_04770 [Vicinamibacterales bacterium]|nr:hypothetical protein [Vicinamibacterales bacterium]
MRARQHVLFVLGVCLAGGLWSSSAAAQTAEARPALKLPALVWSTATGADWITTYEFAAHDRDLLHEANPLIRGLDTHPAWLVAAGASIDAATGWAAYRLLGRGHPRVAALAFYAAAAYRAFLSVHNVEMMREADAIRTIERQQSRSESPARP